MKYFLLFLLSLPALGQPFGFGDQSVFGGLPAPVVSCNTTQSDFSASASGNTACFNSSARKWVATKFTNTTATAICKVILHGITASGSPTGWVTNAFYTYTVNGPGTLVGSWAGAVSKSLTGDVEIASISASLAANTAYCLVSVSDTTDASHYVTWDYQTYFGGQYWSSSDGSSWSSLNTSNTRKFTTYSSN